PKRQRELEEVESRLVNLYDECLLGLDAQVGRFLDGLREAGILADTWGLITADHGENFGEHDLFGHGSSPYNEQTHVPLLLIPPTNKAISGEDPAWALRGLRIGVPVSLRDLPRTMTEVLLPRSENPFPGHSLARHWNTHDRLPADLVFSQ